MCSDVGMRSIAFLLLAASAQGAETVTIPAAGLKQPAEILIDKWGVPHIYAGSVDDAFFAQGFNAARDRLFQIDLWRRRGLGLLAEVLGPSYAEQDRAARLFLYRGDMRKEWAAYGPDAKRIATSFSDGVNAYVEWLATHQDRLPLEFKIRGIKPTKWAVEDVVRIRSHGLTRNLTSEVARANTICKTDVENGLKYDGIRSGLQPPWESKIPEGLDPCLPADVLRVFNLAKANARVTGEEGRGEEGSNNWAIAPSKTATGRAMLAGDPHRAHTTPSLRYIAHISAPGMDVIGAGEPSLPGISMGHNGTAAFGLTIFNIDQEDLYVYELNPRNPRQYRYKGAWETMRAIPETIRVKGAQPIAAELVFTRHGPVIYTDAVKNRAYAVRTCWLEAGMSPYFGSVASMRTHDFAGFQREMRNWGAPTVNQVYADVKGNIGWIAAGLTPVRPNWDGLLPVPGDGRYEWAGFLPADKLPSSYNPPAGYVTTSNEMNLPSDYPYRERKPGFEWTNDSRHSRIDEVLRSLPKVSMEDSMKLQNDVTSIPARRLLALLAPLKPEGLKTRAALDFLRGWDAAERADSPQAALMEVWIARHLGKAFRAAVLPEKAATAIGSTDIAVMLRALEKPDAKWERVLLDSLTAACLEMEKLQGPRANEWQWGKLHRALPEHPMLNAVSGEIRRKLQPGPFETGGSAYTPNQSQYRESDFRMTNGPSFRMVLDVGNWDNSRAVNFPGQSGDPENAHYGDLAKLWLSGEYFPLLYTRAAIEKAAETRIVLQPSRSAGDR